MANNNIGHVKCPISGHLSVVRADKRNKLYYFSQYGKITPNLPQGQEWLRDAAVLWPDAVQPDNVRLKTLFAGSPPVVTISNIETTQGDVEKPLTQQVESTRDEKALTPPVEKVPTPKAKKSAMALLLDGWGEDDE